MDTPESNDLFRQLDAIRAQQLRWIADQHPTLTRLKQALAVERAMQQRDPQALLAFMTALEERFTT